MMVSFVGCTVRYDAHFTAALHLHGLHGITY